MILLACDTSSPCALIALQTADGLRSWAESDPAVRHGRSLLPMIRDLLAARALKVPNLDLLAVGLGPGSFTGVRIGLTAARTLAYAISRPIVGLDSLELLAQSAPESARQIAVLAPSQRGELYLATFVRDPDTPYPRRLEPTRFVTTADWATSLAPGSYVMGPALDPLRPHWPAHLQAAEPAANRLSPHALLDLALRYRHNPPPPETLEPFYLRKSAAEEKWNLLHPPKPNPAPSP